MTVYHRLATRGLLATQALAPPASLENTRRRAVVRPVPTAARAIFRRPSARAARARASRAPRIRTLISLMVLVAGARRVQLNTHLCQEVRTSRPADVLRDELFVLRTHVQKLRGDWNGRVVVRAWLRKSIHL